MPIKTKLTTLTPSTERLKTTIQLISGGYSIREASPDGKLTVFPWDSEVSQWVIDTTNQDNDQFAARVVSRLTRLDQKVVDAFVASELMLVMLVARSLVTSGTLTYTAQCPHCGRRQAPSTIRVPHDLGKVGEKALDYRGVDLITLPTCGDELAVRPVLVRDQARLSDESYKRFGLSRNALQSIMGIVEVGGGTPDKLDELVTYYRALPPSDVEFLARKQRELSPALDLLVPHVCDNPECNKPFQHNLGLSYDFFLSSLQ